jgi:hypothetical protein
VNVSGALSGSCPAGLDASRCDPARGWTLAEAVTLCVEIEAVCPAHGCHVALTGGTLYKTGERKDLDLLFYRIRQTPEIDMDGLWAALATIGINKVTGFGWCHKAEFDGRKIDCFFPEEDGSEYPTHNEEDDGLDMVPFPEAA